MRMQDHYYRLTDVSSTPDCGTITYYFTEDDAKLAARKSGLTDY